MSIYCNLPRKTKNFILEDYENQEKNYELFSKMKELLPDDINYYICKIKQKENIIKKIVFKKWRKWIYNKKYSHTYTTNRFYSNYRFNYSYLTFNSIYRDILFNEINSFNLIEEKIDVDKYISNLINDDKKKNKKYYDKINYNKIYNKKYNKIKYNRNRNSYPIKDTYRK